MQDVEKLKTGESRAVKGYQFTRIAAGSGTARSHNFTGSQGDSAEVTLNWNIVPEEFSLYMKNGKDNVFSNAQMLTNMISQHQRNIRTRLGRGLLTTLHAGRTAHSTGSEFNATWNGSTNAYEITDKEMFFSYLRSVLEQNDYLGGLDVIVDSKLAPLAKHLANQGGSNASNLAYQFDGLDVMPHTDLSTNVATAYTTGGVAIAMPQNAFGYIPFIPQKYREGFGDSFDSYNGAGSVIDDEIFGTALQYTIRGYSVRADGSSNGGATDDILTHWQMSAEVAVQVAELSASNETPIYEIAFVG